MTLNRDYSLIGEDARRAVERGLSQAQWYRTEVPRKRMKELMQRRNGPAIRADNQPRHAPGSLRRRRYLRKQAQARRQKIA